MGVAAAVGDLPVSVASVTAEDKPCTRREGEGTVGFEPAPDRTPERPSAPHCPSRAAGPAGRVFGGRGGTASSCAPWVSNKGAISMGVHSPSVSMGVNTKGTSRAHLVGVHNHLFHDHPQPPRGAAASWVSNSPRVGVQQPPQQPPTTPRQPRTSPEARRRRCARGPGGTVPGTGIQCGFPGGPGCSDETVAA